MVNTKMSLLEISDIRLWVSIGCSAEERALPRCIRLDIQISFDSSLRAHVSDKLEDTVCYKTMVEKIKELCTTREFNLIECVSGEVHRLVCGTTTNQLNYVNVKATKLSPPVHDIHGGVSFTYSGE